MKGHGIKLIAPIVITVLLAVYLIFYFTILIFALPGIIWKIAIGIIPVALLGVAIFVCVERAKEIEGGEEDDLSKY